MSEASLLTVVLALIAAAAGGLLGWLMRAERFRRERLMIAATWQEKLNAEELLKDRLRKQIRSLGGRLEDARRGEREARRRLATLETELAGVVQSRVEAETELVDAQIALASTNRRRDELHRQLQRLLARSRDMMAASRAKDEKIFTLSRELDSWQRRLPPLVDRFREKSREANGYNEALDQERERSRELEDTLKTRILPLVDSAADSAVTEGSELRRRLETSEAECRRLSQELAAAGAMIEQLQQAREGNGADSAAAHDLKRIRGVGPAIERLLNDLGIYRLDQIAAFDAADMRRVQAELRDFPDRVERDDWVGQARRLIGASSSPIDDNMNMTRRE